MLTSITEYFAVLGAATLLYIVLKISWGIFQACGAYVKSKLTYNGVYLRSKGPWAVVTGATDGIGKEYALQLAAAGINIVLISRTEAKLKDVADEIEAKYKVKTKTITADFSQGMSIYERIKQGLKGLDIGMLVNNVGLAYEYPEYFLEIQNREKVFMDLIHVNCTSVTIMISIVLPSMVKKKNGVIINISSAAGSGPTPLLTVYSACKAYVSFLSCCLHYEYRDKGIIVQCVSPYFVCSNMSKVRTPNLLIPSAKTYVKSALSTVRFARDTNGYWPHTLMHLIFQIIPKDICQELKFFSFNEFNKRFANNFRSV